MSDVQLVAVEPDSVRPLPVPPAATGFNELYGGFDLGVYSVLRTFDHNKFFCLQAHLTRTQKSIALLGWNYSLDEARLRRALHQLTTAYPAPNATIRFDVLARPSTSRDGECRLLIALIPFVPYPANLYRFGAVVDFAPALHRDLPLAKTANFIREREQYDTSGGIHEYLLTGPEQTILEGSNSNFYGIQAGVLRTAGEGVLEGITRRIIFRMAEELSIPVRYEPVRIDEISALDEAGISSSSRGLMPVVKIGTELVGSGRPGPVCRSILTAYNSFVQREVKKAVA